MNDSLYLSAKEYCSKHFKDFSLLSSEAQSLVIFYFLLSVSTDLLKKVSELKNEKT